ncbi:hypothetical protein NOJ05_01825 [Neorhizobium galegae]|uniref:hypothetical protein n=1 Tax=Neorhizobium galegae TaxID=399 RepID=UPI0006229226|nr:hypothetical protein [Neorhizobium galegae]CDZ29915.1 RADC family protein [Neorhizobium galegae bv. officinalis]KAB1108687.1 hypothetical protein F4V89_29025 [Neorhizobium galegae]MCQ1768171.1 hypothetical protein [Neorhizobium galegae]MCQ1775931.1 hypothetical protein [Neorhizobium galegae]MCQ1797893.1 hypothetical protein [Neorhizobium galegae]
MKYIPYVGSGPYCYANSFAMMLGADAPSTAAIEFATSSPFGMQLVGGTMPFFDPFGWTPEAGFDAALDAMGWTSVVTKSNSKQDALAQLKSALPDGPVWVGPVEMGHFRHQPGMNGPIGADHYVVVLAVDDEGVRMHDPHGFPFSTLPLDDFLTAWRAETIDYGDPYTMRTHFRRVRVVREDDVIRASLPAALRWLSMEHPQHVPEGTIGNEDAAQRLASMIEGGCSDNLRGHLIHFAVRVGARRLADAATCLARIGEGDAAGITSDQALLIGSLQFPLVAGRDAEAAAILRKLAPTYSRLLSTIDDSCSGGIA